MTRNMAVLFFLLPLAVASSRVFAMEPPELPQRSAESSNVQPVPEAEDGEERPMSVWMGKKLKHSQALFRGLAMGDFEDVKYNAARLKLLNRVEGFVRRRNPEYRIHLNTFSRVSAEIERQAEKENIEGATLAFNQLTVSCVDCHKSLRNSAKTLEEQKSSAP